jgi:N4-gp56 family major capsid protein
VPNTFGFGSDTTGFSSTIHDAIQKDILATLRAGLIALPRGAVVPASVVMQSGENFTLRTITYPDVNTSAVTNPLTEGVAPSPIKFGVDSMDWTVAQAGAWGKVTDIARYQSPHNLESVAAEKVKRLAAEWIDSIAQTALATVSSTEDTANLLNTDDLLDAKSVLQGRDVEPIPGVGYYCLLHPYALRGLEGEMNLNGYVDVQAQAAAGALTKGAVGQYRGITFLTSTKFVDDVGDGTGNFPVYFLGKDSMAAGDVGTLSFHFVKGAQVGNELDQFHSAGFKAIFGAKPFALANRADGAGTNGSDVTRVVKITVQSGVQLS